MNINHFTVAYDKYEVFILPFIYCIHKVCPNDFVEIVTSKDFIHNNQDKINYLKKMNNRFLIRESNYSKKMPYSSLRFFEKPVIKSIYLYITDIDILLFQNDFHIHLNQISNNNTFFSNIVRPYQKRLSGLHFTFLDDHLKMINYYTKNDEQLSKKEHIVKYCKAEHGLYNMVQQYTDTLPELLTVNNIRPVHGLHMSLNREPYGKVLNWNIRQYEREIRQLTKDDHFVSCCKNIFDSEFVNLFNKIEIYNQFH